MTPDSPAPASPRSGTSLPARIGLRGRRGGTVLIALLLGVLIAGPTAAWGAWHSQATLPPATASTGVVGSPTGLECQNVPDGLLQNAAQISWQPPAGRDATSYQVLIDDGEAVTEISADPGETSLTLSRGLLENLVGGLLDLLFGGNVVDVTVVAVHPSGWVSAEPAASVSATGDLFGIYCA